MKVFEDIELLIWLKNNVMKANADKFHQLLSSKVEVCADLEQVISKTVSIESYWGSY